MLRDLAIITLGLSYIVNIALSITVVGPDPASLMPACLRWLCAGLGQLFGVGPGPMFLMPACLRWLCAEPDLFLGGGPGPTYFWPWSGIFLVLVQFHVVDQVQRLWVLRPSVAKVLDQVQALKFDRVQKLTRPRPTTAEIIFRRPKPQYSLSESFWTRSKLFLAVVWHLFGLGPISCSGPGPMVVGSTALSGKSAGPGPTQPLPDL